MSTEMTQSSTSPNALALAGQVANQYAAADTFVDYASRKADNTLKAQRDDLATWAAYLAAVTTGAAALDAVHLQTEPAAWAGVSWGLVAGFVRWMLAQGYAVGTVNRKLSTVKVYCKLSAQAGTVDVQEAALIRTVGGYGQKEGKRVDERREQTRTGHKKAQHVPISAPQAKVLKQQPDTPQGRRDALLMALLLDHGLRVGEVARLQVADVDLREGMLNFYRPKVDKVQKHRLTADTLLMARAWLENDAPSSGPLLCGSRKGGELTGPGMSERAISERVRVLGELAGLEGLSAHDCRHYWATRAATEGTDAFALRDAGGWSSLAMPSRYVEAATVANERVKGF